jgi:hypothetical protein
MTDASEIAIESGRLVSRNFLFGLENGTIVHPPCWFAML